jgi:hypothetical protein
MNAIVLTKAPEPETPDEALFIRGFPYFAPRTAKQVAFALDNGVSAEILMKRFKGFKHPYLGMDVTDSVHHFIKFYVEHNERAKELFIDYSNTDLDSYRF